MNANTWLGTLVHKIAEGILLQIRAGIIASDEQISKKLKKKFDEFILSSKEKRFLTYPRRGGLYEDYYGFGITEEQRKAMYLISKKAIKNFIKSDIINDLKFNKETKTLWIEDFLSFDYNKVPIVVKVDFACEKNGSYSIYDWKTGISHINENNKTNSNCKNNHQLQIYAYYLAKIIKINPEKIRLFKYFLYPNKIEETKINSQELSQTEEFMKKSISEMQELLSDKENNIADQKDFEMTKNIEKCSFCRYKELCYNGTIK